MWCKSIEVNGEHYISTNDVVGMIDDVGGFLRQARDRFSKEDSFAAIMLFEGLWDKLASIGPGWAEKIGLD